MKNRATPGGQRNTRTRQRTTENEREPAGQAEQKGQPERQEQAEPEAQAEAHQPDTSKEGKNQTNKPKERQEPHQQAATRMAWVVEFTTVL